MYTILLMLPAHLAHVGHQLIAQLVLPYGTPCIASLLEFCAPRVRSTGAGYNVEAARHTMMLQPNW